MGIDITYLDHPITFIFLVYSKMWNKPFILTIDPNFQRDIQGTT